MLHRAARRGTECVLCGDAERAARVVPLDYERGGGDWGIPRVHPRCTLGHGPGWDAGKTAEAAVLTELQQHGPG